MYNKVKKATEKEEIKQREKEAQETRAWVNARKNSLGEFQKKNEFVALPMLQVTPNSIQAGFTLVHPEKELSPDEHVSFNKEKMPLYMEWQKQNNCIVEPMFMTTLSSVEVHLIFRPMEDGEKESKIITK